MCRLNALGKKQCSSCILVGSWRQTMSSARDRSPRRSNAANRSMAISRANTHSSSDARNFYVWHPVNSVNETRQGIFPLTSGARLETYRWINRSSDACNCFFCGPARVYLSLTWQECCRLLCTRLGSILADLGQTQRGKLVGHGDIRNRRLGV